MATNLNNLLKGSYTNLGTATPQTFKPTTTTTLTSQNTKATPVINLAPKPDNTNYAGMITAAAQQAQTYTTPSGAKVDAQGNLISEGQQQTQQPQQKETFDVKSYIDAYLGVEQPSATDINNQVYKNSNYDALQQDVLATKQIEKEAQVRLSTINSQLQDLSIQAQYVPVQLQQDSEGRGRTATGLAPIQADQLRALALRALPLQIDANRIQAEVQQAQGNTKAAQELLTVAEGHLNRMVELQMQDAQNKYERQIGLIEKVFEFADKQQQRQLQAIEKQADRDFQVQQDEIKYKQQLQRDKMLYQQDINKINLQNSFDNPTPDVTQNVPLVNPTTGTIDPASQISNVINSTGAKTDDKLKMAGAVVSAAQSFANLNKTGSIKGTGVGNLVPGIFLGQSGQNTRTSLAALEGTVEAWMTGASVSEDQQKRIKTELVPQRTDSDGVIRRKINALTNYMMQYVAGSLSTQGVQWTPDTIDFFAPVVITSPDGDEWETQ